MSNSISVAVANITPPTIGSKDKYSYNNIEIKNKALNLWYGRQTSLTKIDSIPNYYTAITQL